MTAVRARGVWQGHLYPHARRPRVSHGSPSGSAPTPWNRAVNRPAHFLLVDSRLHFRVADFHPGVLARQVVDCLLALFAFPQMTASRLAAAQGFRMASADSVY